MIRNLTSSQLKIFYIYIFCFSLYSYIILGITTSSSFLSPIIINNSHSFIISMLFRNLTLIFFFLLIRQFDVCEIHSRSFYQTYHPKYYRYVFLFFVFLFFFQQWWTSTYLMQAYMNLNCLSIFWMFYYLLDVIRHKSICFIIFLDQLNTSLLS